MFPACSQYVHGAYSTATLTPFNEYRDLGYCCGTISGSPHGEIRPL